MSDRRRQDALVREYLRRLGWGLQDLDAGDRDALMAEVTDHIALARAELDEPDEEAVRQVLARMGTPEEIAEVATELQEPRLAPASAGIGPDLLQQQVEEALAGSAPAAGAVAGAGIVTDGAGRAPDGMGRAPGGAGRAPEVERETQALGLLLTGGFLLVAGWFVGVVLLWRSKALSTRDKILGTAVLPGGLLPAAYVLLWPIGGLRDPVGRVLQVALCVLLPFGTYVYLHWRLRAVEVESGFELFRARRAAHAAERARNEMGLR